MFSHSQSSDEGLTGGGSSAAVAAWRRRRHPAQDAHLQAQVTLRRNPCITLTRPRLISKAACEEGSLATALCDALRGGRRSLRGGALSRCGASPHSHPRAPHRLLLHQLPPSARLPPESKNAGSRVGAAAGPRRPLGPADVACGTCEPWAGGPRAAHPAPAGGGGRRCATGCRRTLAAAAARLAVAERPGPVSLPGSSPRLLISSRQLCGSLPGVRWGLQQGMPCTWCCRFLQLMRRANHQLQLRPLAQYPPLPLPLPCCYAAETRQVSENGRHCWTARAAACRSARRSWSRISRLRSCVQMQRSFEEKQRRFGKGQRSL